jgi:hypothetical protein
MSYIISRSGSIILSETILSTPSIDLSSRGLTSTTTIITIYLKKSNATIILTAALAITNTLLGPLLQLSGNNPKSVNYHLHIIYLLI